MVLFYHPSFEASNATKATFLSGVARAQTTGGITNSVIVIGLINLDM